MEKIKLFGLVLLIFVVSTEMSNGLFYVDNYISSGMDRESGIPKTDWYDVADWEVEVCMKWGGPNKLIDSGVGTMSNEKSIVDYTRVATIQAEKTDIIPSSGNEQLVNVGATVYEVAWFIRPLETDKDMSFEVSLIKQYGQPEVIDSGSANYFNPARSYRALPNEGNYTKAKLKFWSAQIASTDLVVDIV